VSDPTLIAVVEDDTAVRAALSELLQVFGVSCCTFDRAEAFLEVYVPGVFACLISDVRLPGISGLDLLQRLKTSGSTMPVFVISSHADPTIRKRVMEYGGDAFLSKPISSDVLVQHLKSALKIDLLPGEQAGDRNG
jgi:FixJ family two-component response regulator